MAISPRPLDTFLRRLYAESVSRDIVEVSAKDVGCGRAGNMHVPLLDWLGRSRLVCSRWGRRELNPRLPV